MKRVGAERTCLVTREAETPSRMIRFARAPTGIVVPDIKEELPGRGVWIGAKRGLVEEAVQKNLFNQGFRQKTEASVDLADLVDHLLAKTALGRLGLARKAGLVITGFEKVKSALQSDREQVIMIVHAREAAEDGCRKLFGTVLQRKEKSEDKVRAPKIVRDMFSSTELDAALGKDNTMHAALKAGRASESFLEKVGILAAYRGTSS